MGKLEAGRGEKGDTILMMPNKASVEVMQVWADEEEVRTSSICSSLCLSGGLWMNLSHVATRSAV